VNCTKTRTELSAYIDGELGARETAAVKSHLTGCAECRRELEELRDMDGFFRAHLPPVDPSPSLLVTAMVRASSTDQEVGVAHWWRIGWAVVGAAAVTMLLLLGLDQFRAYREEQAILQQIDAQQMPVPVKNVFSLSRYESGRDLFDYRSSLAGKNPFKIVQVKNGGNPKGGQQ